MGKVKPPYSITITTPLPLTPADLRVLADGSWTVTDMWKLKDGDWYLIIRQPKLNKKDIATVRHHFDCDGTLWFRETS